MLCSEHGKVGGWIVCVHVMAGTPVGYLLPGNDDDPEPLNQLGEALCDDCMAAPPGADGLPDVLPVSDHGALAGPTMTMSRRTIIADAMRSDVFVYLAGPITPQDGFTLADNVQQALEVFCHLLRRGIPAFCPHLTASEFDLDYETWLAYDLAVLARCTHVMLLPRWASSPGAVQERAFALSRSIPLVESILSLEQVLPARRPDGALL